MNSKSSKTSNSHRLLLNLSDKIDLKRGNKIKSCHLLYIEKCFKNHTKCRL